MNTELILTSICLLFSFLNFVFTVFLSNSVFRFFSRFSESSPGGLAEKPESGLVDPKNSMTYDRRFFR